MSTCDDFGWHDRAIALASLGAAALSRLAFTTADVLDEKPMKPVEMQVLVTLALQDSLPADSPQRTGSGWLSRALRLELPVVEETIEGLEQAKLVRRAWSAQIRAEIESDLPEHSGEDAIAAERPVVITQIGLQIVKRWLNRTRRHFGSWPPYRPDVDDAVG